TAPLLHGALTAADDTYTTLARSFHTSGASPHPTARMIGDSYRRACSATGHPGPDRIYQEGHGRKHCFGESSIRPDAACAARYLSLRLEAAIYVEEQVSA